MNISRSKLPISCLLNRRLQSTGRPPKPIGKLLPTLLLTGGATATGLGAYYYYDPNAEIFRTARSTLGLPNTSTNCEPEKKEAVKNVLLKPETAAKKPVPPPPVIKQQPPKQPIPVPAPPVIAAVVAPPPPPVIAPPPPVQEVKVTKTEQVVGVDSSSVPKSLLVTALRAQQEAISEAYDAKIKVIQDEYDRKISTASMVSEAERFVELKAKYHKASAALAAIEEGIEARQDQNTRAKRLRSLWAQVNAVHARVNHPEYHSSTVTKIDKMSLLNSIEVPDKFVSQMVSSLPATPVHSLESLKDRFYNQVEPVCKSSGLINNGERFSLWKYALGTLGGKGVAKVTPAGQLSENKSLIRSTHDALSVARKALEKSDLLEAAIAVSNLNGLPREVASEWLSDARTLLEANQTLFVLMTYAASNNVF